MINQSSKCLLNACLMLGLSGLAGQAFAQTNVITSPSNGDELLQLETFSITANVSDPDGINSVRLWQSDGTTSQVIGLLNNPPYTWDVTGLPIGTYTFYTRSKDNLNNTLDSNTVTVNMIGGYNRINTPDDGATFTNVESFTVEAEIADPDGINSVRLWMNDGVTNTVVGDVLNAPPFEWEFAELAPGTYSFSTRLKDNLGNLTSSDPVSVTITNDDGTGDGTFPAPGTTVAFTASVNGKYVSAANTNSELIANRDNIGAYEMFEIVKIPNSEYIALKCLGNNKYVVAESGGTASLRANRSSAGNWEQFKFTERGNDLGFVAKANGMWVAAESAGRAPLIANRTAQGGYESFSWSEVVYSPDPVTPDPVDPDPVDPGVVINFPVDQSKLEVGPMVGHVTNNSANLWVRVKSTSNVDVYYHKANTTLAQSKAMAKAESNDYSYRATVTGLSANTNYKYAVVVDDKYIIGQGSFKTAPQRSSAGSKFSFALASCAKSSDDSVQSAWMHMKNANPNFVMFLGDTIYHNAYTLSQYMSSNRKQKEVGHFANIIKDVPMYTGWDDHDFGGNNSNEGSSRGGVPGSTLKNIALDAFIDAWANPTSGSGSNKGAYYSFSWGDVDVFVLDNRYHRTTHWNNSNSKQLGDAQLNWLKSKLSSSTATFKLICNGGGYGGGTSNGEGFQGYPTEFQNLRNHIISQSIDGIVWLSGDVHKNELKRHAAGNMNFGYPVWNIISSGVGRSDKRGKWAKIEVDTTVSDPTLKVSYYEQNKLTATNETGNPDIPSVSTYTLKLSNLKN